MRRSLPSRADAALAAAFGALGLAELAAEPAFRDDLQLLVPLALAMAGALAWRSRHAVACLAVLVVLMACVDRVIAGEVDDPMAVVFALVVGFYSVGAHARGRALAAGVALGIVAVAGAMWQDPDGAGVGAALFYGFFLVAPLGVGYAMRRRREREGVLAAEGTALARAAVAEERARIARELHDVVAHGISVMVLQARGGRRSLDADPEAARGAFDAIEASGRDALAEMRRLLDMLRRDDEELALAPQPSLRHLDELLAQVAEAGLPVTLEVAGEPCELPPGVDLTAFRIVQEALTNALRHAGPATACVRVAYAPDGVEVEVADTGRTAPAVAPAGGHGLVGMRERARLYGGEVEAGAGRGGGFRVRARLPLQPADP